MQAHTHMPPGLGRSQHPDSKTHASAPCATSLSCAKGLAAPPASCACTQPTARTPGLSRRGSATALAEARWWRALP